MRRSAVKRFVNTIRVSVLLVALAGVGSAGPLFNVQPVVSTTSQFMQTPDIISTDFTFTAEIFKRVGISVNVLSPIYSSSVTSSGFNFTSTVAVASNTIAAYFVDSIYSGGYRGYALGSAVAVASVQAWDTLAHELAHVLTSYSAISDPNASDPAHSTDPYNLLAGGGIRYTPSSLGDLAYLDQITSSQLSAMLASVFMQSDVVTQPPATTSGTGGGGKGRGKRGKDEFGIQVAEVPEPGTWIFMGIGLIAVAAIRRTGPRA